MQRVASYYITLSHSAAIIPAASAPASLAQCEPVSSTALPAMLRTPQLIVASPHLDVRPAELAIIKTLGKQAYPLHPSR